MLKSSKIIIPTNKTIINGAAVWLKINDRLLNNNQQILFYKIFVEETKYTIKDLSKIINYSERSVFRKIKSFVKLIIVIDELKEVLVEMLKNSK